MKHKSHSRIIKYWQDCFSSNYGLGLFPTRSKERIIVDVKQDELTMSGGSNISLPITIYVWFKHLKKDIVIKCSNFEL